MNTLPNLSVLNQAAPAFAPAGSTEVSDGLPPDLAAHAAFSNIFRKDKLTVGLIAPFKGYADSPFPDISDLGELAVQADELGFAALWVRDVPFYDPHFGDVGQGLDPFVTLGLLAAKTRNIALGTAGIVAPLRAPAHIAKAAASVDNLSGGRFVLGLSSGDRPVEYPVFNENFDNRAERFRESFDLIRTLTDPKSRDFPHFQGTHYGSLTGSVDTYPKPAGRLPMVAVGRARQEFDWLANTADAWIWHGVNPKDTAKIVGTLAALSRDGYRRPFGYANFVEVSENPHEPVRLYNNIYLRGGSKGLAEFWQEQREQGLAHVTLNLKPTRRPAGEVLQDLAQNVLPLL